MFLKTQGLKIDHAKIEWLMKWKKKSEHFDEFGKSKLLEQRE